MAAMATHEPAKPHGPVEEIAADIFFVTGTSTPEFGGHRWQYSRNMTVLRQGGALTLVNTVRLDDAGLAALDGLGKVEHVVKLGAFHGMDDAFYVERYGARQWALAGMQHEGGHATDQLLEPGGPMPIDGCSLFAFETSTLPEGLLLLDRDGGVLVSCDSLQNWTGPDRFFSAESAERMAKDGWFRPANIGPGWRAFCTPERSDLERVLELRFRHLLPAHGTPIRGDAHEQVAATLAALSE